MTHQPDPLSPVQSIDLTGYLNALVSAQLPNMTNVTRELATASFEIGAWEMTGLVYINGTFYLTVTGKYVAYITENEGKYWAVLVDEKSTNLTEPTENVFDHINFLMDYLRNLIEQKIKEIKAISTKLGCPQS